MQAQNLEQSQDLGYIQRMKASLLITQDYVLITYLLCLLTNTGLWVFLVRKGSVATFLGKTGR